MKKYQKKKAEPNSPGPKYRTPSRFQAMGFTGKKQRAQVKTNPASFNKTQHKG